MEPLDKAFFDGRVAGLREAIKIIGVKSSQLMEAQKKNFVSDRDLAIGVLNQTIKSLRRAKRRT